MCSPVQWCFILFRHYFFSKFFFSVHNDSFPPGLFVLSSNTLLGNLSWWMGGGAGGHRPLPRGAVNRRNNRGSWWCFLQTGIDSRDMDKLVKRSLGIRAINFVLWMGIALKRLDSEECLFDVKLCGILLKRIDSRKWRAGRIQLTMFFEFSC